MKNKNEYLDWYETFNEAMKETKEDGFKQVDSLIKRTNINNIESLGDGIVSIANSAVSNYKRKAEVENVKRGTEDKIVKPIFKNMLDQMLDKITEEVLEEVYEDYKKKYGENWSETYDLHQRLAQSNEDLKKSKRDHAKFMREHKKRMAGYKQRTEERKIEKQEEKENEERLKLKRLECER